MTNLNTDVGGEMQVDVLHLHLDGNAAAVGRGGGDEDQGDDDERQPSHVMVQCTMEATRMWRDSR